MPPALEGHCVQYVGVARVEVHVRDARVLADFEDCRPRAAPVGGLEEPPVAPRRPQPPHRGRVDHVRVARIDQDLADVLRRRESGVRPGPSPVQALVDAVPPPHAALARVLTGPEPDHVRVGGVDDDGAGGVGRVVVKDGGPGRAAVLGLPDVGRGGRHVPDAPVARVHRHIRDPAGHERRADAAEFQCGQEALVHCGGYLRLGAQRGECREDGGQGDDGFLCRGDEGVVSGRRHGSGTCGSARCCGPDEGGGGGSGERAHLWPRCG